MKAKEIIDELSLAVWEMAEAASREKSAAILRQKASKRIAFIHLEFSEALKTAEDSKNQHEH